MNRDETILRFLLSENRFFRFSEVKDELKLHNQQISTSLKRLEQRGLLLRDIQYDGHVPRNVYLGLDSEDLRLKVTIVDNHGELCANVTYEEEDGSSTSIGGIDLGEMTGYIKQVDDELILQWPEWINVLAEKNKVAFRDFNLW